MLVLHVTAVLRRRRDGILHAAKYERESGDDESGGSVNGHEYSVPVRVHRPANPRRSRMRPGDEQRDCSAERARRGRVARA
jgi:hypothetical protein